MKLLQCNIQGRQHIDKIAGLTETYNPDVICLQEADTKILEVLTIKGYINHFLPIIKRQAPEGEVEEGVVLAAKEMKNVEKQYYHYPKGRIILQNKSLYRGTNAQGYIMGDCIVDGVTYRVGTTHFTWTARGDIACVDQKTDMKALLSQLNTEPVHILCGDFNIPRAFNPLYKDLVDKYVDAIPKQYMSSLDKSFHRMGSVASRSHLFTHFMVDYIFTQPPYQAENVELIFGVSDHAAVIADMYLEA